MQFKKREKKLASLEITPLIDVVFLLLIFFMVSTTFAPTPQLSVQLPESGAQPALTPPKVLELVISKEQQFSLEGKTLPRENLRTALQALLAQEPRPLVIQADGKTLHELVVYAMDQAQSAGVKKIAIATLERRK